MERILAVIEAQERRCEVLFRACLLAQRTLAKVYVLLVLPSGCSEFLEREARKMLEPLIDKQRNQGTPLEYYIVEGELEREVIRFIMEHNIDLIVWFAGDNDERFKMAVNVQRTTGCRLEFVRSRMKR